jgi:hypothetical protein
MTHLCGDALRGGFPELEPTARALPRVCRIPRNFLRSTASVPHQTIFLFASIFWGTGVLDTFDSIALLPLCTIATFFSSPLSQSPPGPHFASFPIHRHCHSSQLRIACEIAVDRKLTLPELSFIINQT